MSFEIFAMGIMTGIFCLVFRFFNQVLPQKNLRHNLVQVLKNDMTVVYDCAKEFILSHRKLVKAIFIIIAADMVLSILPIPMEIIDVVEDVMMAIMFCLLVIIFAPQEGSRRKGFPNEVFGFTYSVILMFYWLGVSVFDIFYAYAFLKEDMWIYGYGITLISYVVCIATLGRFMDRDLSKLEIVFLGMIMMTTLEFITYYGIGYFNNMELYDPDDYESNLFGNISLVINRGIYVASQSQILERTPMEIWGNIILNGTDALTITAVLGYLVQKFTTK